MMAPDARLAHWKNFRNSLSGMAEIDQLAAVAEYWKWPPLKSVSCDPEALDLLPTPWEMMSANDWCRNSVAIGMDFTLRLSGWDSSRLLIKMMRDYDISEQKLVLEIDGKKLLNYDYGMVTDIPNTRFDFIETWKFVGKKYQR